MIQKRQTLKADRPKQETPGDLVGDLMQAVRSGFYGDCPEKWFADQRFIKERVVLWPATWLNERGVTLPPERYKAILLEIFQDIKANCRQMVIKYWPGYLAKCVQDHFRHQGEKYYEEGKSVRAAAERALLAFSRAKETNQAADPVAALAQAQQVLATGKKKPKVAKTKDQLSLF